MARNERSEADQITISGPGGVNETVDRTVLTGNQELWQRPILRKLLRWSIQMAEKAQSRGRLVTERNRQRGTANSNGYRTVELTGAAEKMNVRMASDANDHERTPRPVRAVLKSEFHGDDDAKKADMDSVFK